MSVPSRSATLSAVLFLALVTAAAAPASAGAADCALVQDSLTPGGTVAAKTDVRATLSVHLPKKANGKDHCIKVQELGVAVRDADGKAFDYPGALIGTPDFKICSNSYTVFTTEPRTFDKGRYVQYGYYKDDTGAYHDLPEATLHVSPVGGHADTDPSPRDSRRLESGWQEDFARPIAATNWRNDESGSYDYATDLPPRDRGTTNLKDNKLDRITAGQVSVKGGWATFSADRDNAPLKVTKRTLDEFKRNGCEWQKKDGEFLQAGDNVSAWKTGLLTTQHLANGKGFKVKTGDYVETRVRLPAKTGAWPALWTWGARGQQGESTLWEGPYGEVDSFEYHPSPVPGPGNPHLLELTNRTKSPIMPAHYINKRDIAPDKDPNKPVKIGTVYGRDSVDWYVNDTKVFSDRKGVPHGWEAYLILNLSVSGNCYGRQPTGPGPITFDADYVHVYR